jgi:hypothetical protein
VTGIERLYVTVVGDYAHTQAARMEAVNPVGPVTVPPPERLAANRADVVIVHEELRVP